MNHPRGNNVKDKNSDLFYPYVLMLANLSCEKGL
jgi:hypothetical protein